MPRLSISLVLIEDSDSEARHGKRKGAEALKPQDPSTGGARQRTICSKEENLEKQKTSKGKGRIGGINNQETLLFRKGNPKKGTKARSLFQA